MRSRCDGIDGARGENRRNGGPENDFTIVEAKLEKSSPGTAINAALLDSDQAVDRLIKNFLEIASRARAVTSTIASMADGVNPSDKEVFDSYLAGLEDSASFLKASVAEAVTNLQFYDRLRQRLDHVRVELDSQRWTNDWVTTQLDAVSGEEPAIQLYGDECRELSASSHESLGSESENTITFFESAA